MNEKTQLTDLLEKSRNRAIFFLKFRPRSEKEVRDNLLVYLRKRKISESDQEKILEATISRLKDLKFIDDRDFIRFWVERRFRENPKGEKIMVMELRQKGIVKDLIDDVLPKILKNYSQEETIGKLLEKADRRYYNLPYLKRKQKLINYVLSRGFSYSHVKELIDEITKKQ